MPVNRILQRAAAIVVLLCVAAPLHAATTWKKISFANSSATCLSGYITVPQYTLPDGSFVPGFCVMQFEAKDGGSGIAISQASGTPYVNLTWRQSADACAGARARLIAENEWLSIAHQVALVASNWTGGTVGNGALYSGHNDDSPAVALSVSNSADGYDQTGNAGGSNQRRTLTLPNGNVIWDFAGNVWEWVGEVIATGSRYHGGTGQWMAYNSTEGGLTAATNMPTNKKPPSNYNANQGMGRYYDGYQTSGAYNNVSEWPDNAGTGYVAPYAAFLRGGSWHHGAYAGVFALILNHGRSYTNGGVGFRCTH